MTDRDLAYSLAAYSLRSHESRCVVGPDVDPLDSMLRKAHLSSVRMVENTHTVQRGFVPITRDILRLLSPHLTGKQRTDPMSITLNIRPVANGFLVDPGGAFTSSEERSIFYPTFEEAAASLPKHALEARKAQAEQVERFRGKLVGDREPHTALNLAAMGKGGFTIGGERFEGDGVTWESGKEPHTAGTVAEEPEIEKLPEEIAAECAEPASTTVFDPETGTITTTIRAPYTPIENSDEFDDVE